MNLQANQTTDTSRCVLLLDALHVVVLAHSPPRPRSSCPWSGDGLGGSFSALSARDMLAKPAWEQEPCSALGTVTLAWQIGHGRVEERETKVDPRNIFSRDHFFLFFSCKQLPCLEDLMCSFWCHQLQRPFLVVAGPSLPVESRPADGDAMQKLAKS